MNRFFESLINLFFPPKCPFCGKILDTVGICPKCERSLPWVPEEEVAFTEKDLTCAAPLWYEGAVREALLRLKFRGGSALAEPFGELLARGAAERFGGEFDTVTWVPVRPETVWKRAGMTSPGCWRRPSAAHWDTRPVQLLNKVQDNPAQSGLQGEAARVPTCWAFTIQRDPELIRDRRVLLIDDIHTTGATLSECVRVLRDNGADSVLCLTAARTPKREKKGKNSQIASCNQGKAHV